MGAEGVDRADTWWVGAEAFVDPSLYRFLGMEAYDWLLLSAQCLIFFTDRALFVEIKS
jgi:hypothetical protein